ncbi:MAG: glycosyltransferase family 4 protein [Actinomycetia bacterium]|nr:glycosyltransferase family 4 protein [Actinomycetes bacterium]MCP4224653.1 glycosyltransferase family 4 protein [Actinomycetes bacterium]MCP5032187.1 glycosyltransferase family 4 protein [Actinomycetes bacterium]
MSGRHLLVTNDFPPKIGGIQSYLWELWRRLPVDGFAIYTTPYPGAATFDANHEMRIERSPEPVIGPYPWLVERLNRFAETEQADLILLDPAVPLGAIGPYLDRPYGVILHGAEVTIPGRLPLSRSIMARTLRSASLVIAAGHYPLAEAERCAGQTLPSVVIPPGVDHERFHPFDDGQRQTARKYFGLGHDDFAVATVNRLVPRKGIETLIRAADLVERRGLIAPAALRVMVGGTGRQQGDLADLVGELGAPVELLGRLGDEDVVRLYGGADAMAMLCHDRWFGLEQEGFGIVFLEAAAAGLPQIAGRSGGAHEAVEHGVTGLIVDEPRSVEATAHAIRALYQDERGRLEMGRAARLRAVESFDYDRLAEHLSDAISKTVAQLG